MTYAPIIIPTLNRYEHLKNCVESLSKNKFASETELYIGLDYPPAEKYITEFNQIKNYLPEIHGFKKVVVIERTQNLGAINNIKTLIKEVLETHDTFIFSEDDNIFSECFLEYVNKGLEKFKDHKTIMSISGFSYPVKMPESDNNVIKMQRYYSDWGFGTWKDRYEMARDTITQDYFDKIFKDKNKSSHLRKLSKKNYIYAFGLCSPSPSENIRPMDYTNSIGQCIENYYSIMPKETFVKNNGWDNSGIHCQNEDELSKKMTELFANQKLSNKKSFDDFYLSEEESKLVNEMVDKSIIGQYDKKYYKKVLIKAFLFRIGLLSFVRKLLRKC